MFSYSPVDVTAAVIAAEAAGGFEIGLSSLAPTFRASLCRDTYVLKVCPSSPSKIDRRLQISCAYHDIREIFRQRGTNKTRRFARWRWCCGQTVFARDQLPPIEHHLSLDPFLELGGKFRVIPRIRINQGLPLRFVPITSRGSLTEEIIDIRRYYVMLLRVHAEASLDVSDIFCPKSCAMSSCISSCRTTNSDYGANIDEGRTITCTRRDESLGDGANIRVAIHNVDDVPVTCLHFAIHVLGVCNIGGSVAGDLVIVVDNTEVVESEMTSR